MWDLPAGGQERKRQGSAERLAERSTRAADGADVISSSLARDLIKQAREEERDRYKPSAAAKLWDGAIKFLFLFGGLLAGAILAIKFGPQPASTATCMELLKNSIVR
jgi:hypothetical protein